MEEFIQQLPKAELHIHIEGSLEPEMLMDFAIQNNIKLKYNSIEEISAKYKFSNLQEFLDLYYQGMSVLITETDFFNLTYHYLEKAHRQNVLHTEIFFDPQGHLSRGIKFNVLITGITKAIDHAKSTLGIDAKLIMCFLRDLSESEAIKTLETALEYREKFIGIGLDSAEIGHPPSKFKNLFNFARGEGLHLVAHAGEEGPASYIWEAIDILGIERIDHGNNAISDPELMRRIAKDKIPLTMCPLSNKCLKVVPNLQNHQLLKFLDAGILATINSDDPAYFGGYINENYIALAKSLNLSLSVIEQLAKNSMLARFID